MKTINPNIYPKGGHYFIERDGAKIVGDSWNGVIARVRAYRKRANYPEGDVTQEVHAQACQRNPILCTDDSGHIAAVQKASIKARVLTWLNQMRGNKPQFVPTELAQQRANICATCPNNQGIPDGCASCRAALAALRSEILGPRPIDGRLNACMGTGEDLPAAVWVESQAVENGALPGHCWRKRQ